MMQNDTKNWHTVYSISQAPGALITLNTVSPECILEPHLKPSLITLMGQEEQGVWHPLDGLIDR